MMSIHRKIVVDEHGNPQEVIIPWDEFQGIAEIRGARTSTAQLSKI